MRKVIPFYDLKLSAATQRAVAQTFRSGWLTTGPAVDRFESGVKKLLRVPHAVAVSSATSGLTLALRAVGVRPGTEVVTTPFSFVAGVEAIVNLGATPVLVDIDPETLNIDPAQVKKGITKRTAAILSVDIAGYPCDYRKLCRISKHHSIPLVSDSAHALGATVNGKSIPAWANLSVFSFHATKNLTSGEGGMVAARDKKLIDKVRLWSKHGMTASAYERKKSGGWSYDVAEVGYKANMSDILAAVGLGELTTFAANQKNREQLAMRYIANLAIVEDYLATPKLEAGTHHAWHLFIVRLNLERLRIDRNQLIDRLAAVGIGCSVHYRPIHQLSFTQKIGGLRRKLPNAEYAGKAVISLPLYPLLKPGDIDHVCDRLIAIIRRQVR